MLLNKRWLETAMAKDNKKKITLSSCKGKRVEAQFTDDMVTSDGGVLLLREIDQQLNLSMQIAQVIPEYRDISRIEHSREAMVNQRIVGLALGYDDLNDHDDLRHDPAIQTAVNKLTPLASSPTLCRLENTSTRTTCVDMQKIMIELFIASFPKPPKRLVLDADPTDGETHGDQEGKHYNDYYKHNCFLPLHIFCGSQLLVSYLRRSNVDGAKHVWAILALLVKRFKQAWPDVQIIFRGDGGLCRHKMMNWCERQHEVYYVLGIPGNARLLNEAKPLIARAEMDYETTQEKVRLFDQYSYGAKSWLKERKVIVKAEHTEKGQNTRFIVTNIDFLEEGNIEKDEVATPQSLYDDWYCPRGDMENKIKELKLDMSSGRTSCHDWWANQFRLLLASFAYILMDTLRRTALKDTELANAEVGTIRLKLLKVGAIIRRGAYCIKFLLSSHFARKDVFYQAAASLVPE